MSPPVSAPSTSDARSSESRNALERKRPRPDDDSDASEHIRLRPLSWQSSDPLGYALNSTTQPRPIGVESILNLPSKVPAIKSENSREGYGEGLSTASAPHLQHTRHPSSPTVHLPSSSSHPAKRLSSPGLRNHHPLIAPASPSARFAPPTGSYGLKPGPVRSPLSQSSRLSSHSRDPSSPQFVDSGPGHPVSTSPHTASAPVLAPVSVQPTPAFHNRQASGNHTPHSSSQETSPTTPVSTYSHYGRSSPAIAAAPPPHASPFGSTYATGELASRIPSALGVPQSGDEAAEPPPPGKILCYLDVKSGSSQQAEKRKANSDASRRFRNRKRNELQMEQKITAQQEDLRKQSEALQRREQEIRALIQERDFYHAERDFFRDHFISPVFRPGAESGPTRRLAWTRDNSQQLGIRPWHHRTSTRLALVVGAAARHMAYLFDLLCHDARRAKHCARRELVKRTVSLVWNMATHFVMIASRVSTATEHLACILSVHYGVYWSSFMKSSASAG
ncbi:uncharacterized protein BP01DRAFT_380549 [Aspergillus saccharolyticus JOP 1030-1]|uniref:BZIP domain-containing protein n=1 Tax=Aspergillus saccharolyticus JOP 1030-1 TaxID=1450539 RepID=A0A318ZKE4_9EURO|nr:hypothetical protein BP01DRAFT_380549 [Aspergillus saccharolyticus JOP 1030-1]PYH47327.1 hypothetical protein BP01DRAFT_380549 [Aspergillus saccharolyticus JOP 1030-1]